MKNCTGCSAELSVGETKCPACGLSIEDGSAETAILPDDPQADTPTRLETPSKRKNKAVTTTGGGARFISGTVLAGRYRIVGLIGKGGMGEVYRADDLELEQTVALKFLPEELAKNEELLRRFRGEVRNARQVSHRNVCRVFDIGETEGLYYITMEHIDGDDLSMLLRRIGRLPSDKAVEISREICMGLAAIHKAGILHRDLKPANIIIDSNGEARITDFGIAGLEAEVQGAEARVGTPAYMSPEQADRKELTKQSDIYSLGLLLYEIFTGKQAFEGDSVQELQIKQATTSPKNPSEIVSGIDPLVENVIKRCLEKDPGQRPESALNVAMSLPGGDPLQVALEAGETPSPKMVAAAPKKGALRPPVALALFAGVLISFAFIVYFSYPVREHRWLPLDTSSELLAQRGRDISRKFGYTYPVKDSAYTFQSDPSYTSFIIGNQTKAGADSWINSPDKWERLATGQPPTIFFWYRQSPRSFGRMGGQRLFRGTFVSLTIPSPYEASDETRVSLDVRGRLLEFIGVPPQVEDGEYNGPGFDWKTAFEEAGLKIEDYQPAESRWTPWTYSDERAAWEGRHVDHPDIPVRIEAASYRGKPVYFQVIAPWDEAFRDEADPLFSGTVRLGTLITLSLIVALAIGGIVIARFNVRTGRADKKGAFRLTLFVFTSMLLMWLLTARYEASIYMILTLASAVQLALLTACGGAISYLAVEPFIRKYWPNLSISWSRLMDGDFRDPLVGRDVLVGGFLGLLHSLAIVIPILIYRSFNGSLAPSSGWSTDTLMGLRGAVSQLAWQLGSSVLFMSFLFLIVVIVALAFRRRWVAIGVVWTVLFIILGLVSYYRSPWFLWIGLALLVTIITVTVTRFGMLAYCSQAVFYGIAWFWPLTTDTTSWYFGVTVFAGLVILVLSAFGFYTSLAGQPIFGQRFSGEGVVDRQV